MADFGAPVAQNVNVNPSQGLHTLSTLLGLKQQQIAISRAQIGLAQAHQELSSETSAATQAAIHTRNMQNLQSQNWEQIYEQGGAPAVEARARELGGVDGPAFGASMANTITAATGAKKALFGLSMAYREPLLAAVGTWAGDKNAPATDLSMSLASVRESSPESAQGTIANFGQHFMQLITQKNMDGSAPSLAEQHARALAISRTGLSVPEVSGAGGLATPEAGAASTGTQIIPTTTNRMTGVTQPSNAPPIANLHTQIVLPNHQVAVLNTATGQYEIAGGGGTPKTPGASAPEMTAQNDPARPSPNAPGANWEQWDASLQMTQKFVQNARQEDASYGNNMAVAQDIRSLSNTPGGKATGPGTPEWVRMMGTITSRFGGSEGITNIQTLESFLDRQAASMTKAMGLPATNLGNEQARVIGGNIGMQHGALAAKNDYNEALAQGLHDFRVGLDRVAGYAGNASPTAVGQFRSEWTKYFNPMAYEYQLAKSRGEEKLMAAIAKSVTPGQAKRMMLDMDMTESLVKTGKLP